jgi:hypothetical protein
MKVNLRNLETLYLICKNKECGNKIPFNVRRFSGTPHKCPACRQANVPPLAATSQKEQDAHTALTKLKDALTQVMVDHEKDLPFHITLEFSEPEPN